MHIFQCLTLYSFTVFNSVSVCLVYMNECLLTFKMWDKIQTIYTADYTPTSCAFCLHHSFSLSAHSLCAARTLVHGPPPSSLHRPGFSHFWLHDRSFPFLGTFTVLPTWKTPTQSSNLSSNDTILYSASHHHLN